MNRIVESRKLLGVTPEVTLAELKNIYRGLIKEYHPDKIQDDDDRKHEYEAKSKQIITAYHLLVSVAPETHAAQEEEYNRIKNILKSIYNFIFYYSILFTLTINLRLISLINLI